MILKINHDFPQKEIYGVNFYHNRIYYLCSSDEGIGVIEFNKETDMKNLQDTEWEVVSKTNQLMDGRSPQNQGINNGVNEEGEMKEGGDGLSPSKNILDVNEAGGGDVDAGVSSNLVSPLVERNILGVSMMDFKKPASMDGTKFLEHFLNSEDVRLLLFSLAWVSIGESLEKNGN